MMASSTAANDAARRLWARSGGESGTAEGVTAAAERLCTQLRVRLGRWIGADGYRALLDRALGLVRPGHPALVGFSCLGEDKADAAAAVGAHGAEEVAAGLVALITGLIELLGRIVGDEMAMRLVEQAASPTSRGTVSTRSKGERNG